MNIVLYPNKLDVGFNDEWLKTFIRATETQSNTEVYLSLSPEQVEELFYLLMSWLPEKKE